MTAPIWITPAGNLGIIPEQQYYELPLDAYNAAGGDLTYRLISGALPNGLRIREDGVIAGIPINGEIVGVPAFTTKVTTSTFTLRVTNQTNELTDRTFNLTVAGILPPTILPQDPSLGSYIDGDLVNLQISAETSNPYITCRFRIISGELPPGVDFSSDGQLYGYISQIISDQTLANTGFDETYYDKYEFDFVGTDVNKNYQFTVEANDGVNIVTKTYTLYVIARKTTGNVDPIFNPILYTKSGSIGNVRQNTIFSYKFDAVDFDNDVISYNLVNGSLPTGLTLNSDTGWISGFTPYGPIGSSNYNFSVNVSKVANSTVYSSETKQYSLVLLGQISDTVDWISSSDLGSIYNGSISELKISAVTASSRTLNYRLVSIGCMPPGLELMIDGTISGRAGFECFALDGQFTTIDNSLTTFDQTYTFTIEAFDNDNYVVDQKEFSLRVISRDLKPYENLYIQILPNREQRAIYESIINNSDIFPPDYIYRSSDPWFGKNILRRSLFMSGLNAETAANYINAMTLNHYWKTLTFGQVKTARALDDNFDVKYEVVYLEILDHGVNAEGLGPNLLVYLPPNSQNISTIYPNSFPNMVERIEENIGYQDRSSLPDWMTSRQKDGTVLGFVRCLVLCYANPGHSSEIAYRVNQIVNSFNLIDFTIDRYDWDSILSDNLKKEPYQGQGNISTTISNVVTGYGTNFTSEINLIPGKTIYANGKIVGNVQFITNANSLILTTNALSITKLTVDTVDLTSDNVSIITADIGDEEYPYYYSSNNFVINNFVSGSSTISANTQSNLVTGITTTINGSGAITGNTGSAVITGIGTAFNNELGLGKTIYYSGNPIGSIASIQSATSLRLLSPINTNLSNVAYTADGASTFFISEITVGDTIAANVGPNLIVLGTVKSIESNVELILTANSTSNVANVAYAHTARDPYTVPGEGDKYLKYPQIGVIN